MANVNVEKKKKKRPKQVFAALKYLLLCLIHFSKLIIQMQMQLYQWIIRNVLEEEALEQLPNLSGIPSIIIGIQEGNLLGDSTQPVLSVTDEFFWLLLSPSKALKVMCLWEIQNCWISGFCVSFNKLGFPRKQKLFWASLKPRHYLWAECRLQCHYLS